MQTAQSKITIITKENKPMVVVCSQCKHVVNFRGVEFKERPLANFEDIFEVGLECPKCGHWFPSFYLNSELKKLQETRDSWDRRARRSYDRNYKQLQLWVKRKLRRMEKVAV